MSNNTENLTELAQKSGIDVDEVVYSVNVADIIEEIAFVYETDDISPERLAELIEVGKKGCEAIDWSNPICHALDAFNETDDTYREGGVK